MNPKKAHARIKINKLLEAAGWRFFDDHTSPANIWLEPGVKIPYANLETQRAIVAEQALVKASRELVRPFEVKIKIMTDRVWSAA